MSSSGCGGAAIGHPQIHEVLFPYLDKRGPVAVRVLNKKAAQLVAGYVRDVVLEEYNERLSQQERLTSFECRFLASCDAIAGLLAGESVPAVAVPLFASHLDGPEDHRPNTIAAQAILFVSGDNVDNGCWITLPSHHCWRD